MRFTSVIPPSERDRAEMRILPALRAKWCVTLYNFAVKLWAK